MTDVELARLRRQATYASVTVAALLIVAKLGAYLITDSVSLLSSLIDSIADLIASSVTLAGVRHALKPADLAHRFGHGKAEGLASLAQAAFVTGSAVFLLVEAAGRLISPVAVQESGVGIAVMLFSIALTLVLLAFQRRVVRTTASIAITADRLHYNADLYLNIAVIAALVLTRVFNTSIFDPLFAVGIAGLLLHGAWEITQSALDVLMDRELPQAERDLIKSLVTGHAATRAIHDLRTRNSGTAAFIEFHLELDADLTLAKAHDVTDEIEHQLGEAFPRAEITIHQEPAGLNDLRLDHRVGEASSPVC
ncbi:MAG: cation diffusion facilitator family transporter [Azospirillaceae bacterium]|nr:cation diffusion facilitator family transporter [Azospirillaceae bacterium]